MPSYAGKSRRRSESHSTYKGRTEWFYERSAFPARDAPPLALESFWASHAHFNQTPDHRWEPAGPTNIAGRVTSLAVHPEDVKRIYAGSAGGGVWISRDQGESWSASWPRFVSQNIGAIAIRPAAGAETKGSYTVFAATGEANLSPDSYPGSGVYQSRDDGLTWLDWIRCPSGNLESLIEHSIQTIPRRIGAIAFDERGLPVLASVSHDDRMPSGLFLGGGLEPVVFWGRRSYRCHSVVYHPRNRKLLYAAIETRGANNGIWRSEDGGTGWTQLTRGLPSGEEFRRTTLAMAPSDPQTIYALAASRGGRVLGLFRSRNGGDSWQEVLGRRFPRERFMSYNNAIVVHPDDPGFVIWGGINLYRTRNGGRNWQRITNRGKSGKNAVHADHHALVMPKGDLVYSGNDGGVAISEDGGDTWNNRSTGMMTTMFYDVDVAATDSSVFGGGCQDNGSLITGIAAVGLGGNKGEYRHVLGGDGAWMAIDPDDEEHIFCSAQGFHIARHRRGERWDIGHWRVVAPKNMQQAEKAQRAIAVIAIGPGTKPGHKTVWAGSHRLWRTADDGRNWKPFTESFDGSVISAIEIADANPDRMYVGTTRGGVYRSLDGGKIWSGDLAGGEIPRRMITRIEVHPKAANKVALTVASSGAQGAVFVERSTQAVAFSHVFFSEDGGRTWVDIDAGALPNVVFNAVTWETRPPYRLFVAGDAGVWVRQDGQWFSITGNMPNVVVSDLVYHCGGRLLTAATYGRGIWRMAVPGKFNLVEHRDDAPHTRFAPGLQEDQAACPPRLLDPPEGAVFGHFPRDVVFACSPVADAIGYAVEFESGAAQSVTTSWTPQLKGSFGGMGLGRWRAWAILPESTRSRISEWRELRFTV